MLLAGISTIASLGLFFVLYSWRSDNPEGRVRDTRKVQAEYDFIIIGAGSAGSVIANRLTEIEEWTVLLLEAGGDESLIGQIPALAANLQLSERDWQYVTEPQQKACLASPGARCLWPRGKMLGGSSSLNYMLYVRGNKRDYDRWASLTGDDSWSYESVLPYFKKSEDNQNPYLAKTKYHGTGGYLTVNDVTYRTPLGAAFIQAGQEMGYDHRDGNGEFQTGFMFAQGTVRRGRRCSTAKAFLRPIRSRRNLHISMNSHVLNVIIDPATKTATGVRFEKGHRIYNVKAKKEVITTAGSLATPQILMLSGIGPAAHLTEKGISPVYADLPVGENLQDHVALGGVVFLIDKPVSVVQNRFWNLPTLLNYTAYGGTPLALFGGVECLAWVKTENVDPDIDWPDIQYHFAPASDVSDGGETVRKAHGIPDSVWNEYYAPIANRDSWSVLPVNLRPKSRGYLKLRSKDPYEKPIINPNYYSDVEDIKTMINGVKIALALSKTEAFQQYGSKIYDKPFPGCEDFQIWTDDYYECWIKQYCVTLAHTVGTCQMGKLSEETTVVDTKLRVKSINHLRVADSSVMPLVPSGNTNAVVIMIAEKASDMIKEAWL